MNHKDDTLVIRSGEPTDFGFVLRLEQLCFDDPWPVSAIVPELERGPMVRPLVIENDGQGVGFLMAWVVADEYHIVNVGVDPDLRRQGLATQLLAAGLTEAVEANCRIATLEVRVSNTSARAFYDRLGFHEAGRRPRYYADNAEDALILSLLLPDNSLPVRFPVV